MSISFRSIALALILVLLAAGCGKVEPTAMAALPTHTLAPPTETVVPPTHTPLPTDTLLPPTHTPLPTDTSLPPTRTPVPSTATSTPTDTPLPPTATALPAPTAESYFDGVRVTFVNNAGFLITVGDKKILIDALFTISGSGRRMAPGTELPEEVQKWITLAQPPFDGVDLILATHTHFDHFSPELVLKHMRHNPDAVFVSHRSAVGELLALGDDVQDRAISVKLGEDRREQIVVNDIELELVHLSHGDDSVFNVGFVITIDGVTLFHMGDMAPDVVNVSDLQSYGLLGKQIDIAFVQLFMLITEEYHAHLLEGIQATHVIPMHYFHAYPPSDVESHFPGAIVFDGTMDSWVLPSPLAPDNETPPLGYVPVFEPAPCQFAKPSGFELDCGYLVVPEDRSQPAGAQVRMHVAIFKSRSPQPQPDPLIYLTGGGGGNELDTTARYLDDGNDAILNRRDFIMYNQRGAKYAQPYLPCEGYAAFMAELAPQNLPQEEAEAQELEFWLGCRDRLIKQGNDLNMYNTSVNADDLNDLRIALGYDKVNIYGTSYGTRLALEVLRRHGEHIRSAIIDSVYPPQVHFFSDYATNAYDTFKRIFDACEADAGCRARYPDIENTFYQVVDDLDANPRTMQYRSSSGEITLTYDGAIFVDALYLLPYLAEAGRVPFVIQSASRGDMAPIEGFIPFTMGISPSDTIADGVQNSILCREETPFDSYERLAELGSRLPPQVAQAYDSSLIYDVCAEWGVDPADAAEKARVVSDVPTLILTGEFDPITPPAWARLAGETLSSSYYYEFPGLGHGVMRSNRCGFQIGLQFLNDPNTEPDASCIDALRGIVFR